MKKQKQQFQQAIILIGAILFINVSWILNWYTFSIFYSLCLFVVVLCFRFWNLFHFLLLFFLISVNSLSFLKFLNQYPVIPLLIPFSISTIVVFVLLPTRQSLSWVKKGNIDKFSTFLVIITGVISTGALILWAFWTDHLGLGVRMVQEFSAYPKGLLLGLGIPVFAVSNAFVEEVLFRGVMQEALVKVINSTPTILIFQASAFAAFHYTSGFPNGIIGYVMAFIYGIMLGYLRIRTKGMLAPYLAHIIADLTIGYFLVGYILF